MTSKIQTDVLKNVNSSVDNLTLGTSGQVTVGGSLNIGGNYNITGSLTLGSALSVANGGTGTGTAFTAGSVVFAGTSGVYSQKNANLFWDNTNNRLGIGTATPSFNLDVSGAAGNGIRYTGNSVSMVMGETGGFGLLGTTTNQNVGLYTNATLRATLDTSGNLGLGVTPSAWSSSGNLELGASGSIVAGGTGIYLGQNWYYGSAAFRYKTTQAATYYLQSGGLHQWFNAPSGTAGANITFTQAMTLDASGNLGVGATSPSTYGKFVSMTGAGSGSGGPASSITNSSLVATASGTGGSLALGVDATGTFYSWIQSTSTSNIAYSLALNPNGGNVGIGTSTPGSGFTGRVLELVPINGSNGTVRVGDFSTTAPSNVSIIEVMGARNDGNGSFQGRLAASYRRCDGTAIANTATLGTLAFGGQWGTDTSYQDAKLLYSASISGVAEGSFTSATAMPTAIVFRTGSTGNAIDTVNVSYGATEAVRIDSNQNLLVGTQTAVGRLTVQGPTSGTMAVSITKPNGLANAVVLNSGTTTTDPCILVQGNGTSTAYWLHNGDIYLPGGTAGVKTFSDIKLKRDVTYLDNQNVSGYRGLSEILQLKPVTYNFKSDSDDAIPRKGFVAQDFEQIFPELVSASKIPGDETEVEYKHISDGGLIPVLVSAIQELAAKVQALEAKVQ